MNLRVTIIDENDVILETVNVYQDGSDFEGAAAIVELIEDRYETEED